MQLGKQFSAKLIEVSDRLFDLIQRFSDANVLVIGDLTLDEFLTGEVERMSREAPVLILRHETTRQVPGGGANAIYNAAKLGATVKAAGLAGKDSQGEAICRIFTNADIDIEGILLESDRPTVTKTRISGHARQSVTQQIVRVDRKSDNLPDESFQSQLADYVRQQWGTVDSVICSDYGDGVLTAPVIAAALEFPQVIVDTQINLQRFAGATLFTPNLPEAEKAVGYAIASSEALTQAGQDLLNLTQAQHILITRGEDGMTLFSRNDSEKKTKIHKTDMSEIHIPAFNRTAVYDVTGAGDTVAAALTLGLSIGATPWEAAVLGNLAASLVVRQFGTATTTAEAMAQALYQLLEDNTRG